MGTLTLVAVEGEHGAVVVIIVLGIVALVGAVWLWVQFGKSIHPHREQPEWRRDPSRRHELRWWDGVSWTEHVSDGMGTTSTDPMP